MIDNPLVSVITVNYKNTRVTNQLLYSIGELFFKNLEVIVIDNAFDSTASESIDSCYDFVKIIRSVKNLGFAGGNNLGIKHAKGKYILLLNNDTEVHPMFMEPMINLLEANESIGAVSPLIKYYYKPEYIQYAGFSSINKITQRIQSIAYNQLDRGQYTKEFETHFAHGCAMMIPKKVINEVGYMNEDFFLYYEEHDWSERIKNKGYKIFVQPKSVVFHKESTSTGIGSPLKTYFINRNRILFMTLHNKAFYKCLSLLYWGLISIPFNIINLTLHGKIKHLSAYVDSILWTITKKTKKRWILS